MSKNQEKLKLDIFPIPEGSILLDPLDFGTKEEKILLALKKLLKERKLESDLNLNIKNYFSEGIFYLNDFAIQIVTTGITSDQISIPIKTWLDNMAAFGKNREIEESIIGMILKDPNLIKEVMTIIPPNVFYIDIHQEIYRAILKIYSQGEDVSLENINKSLKENTLFKLSGGQRILNELLDNISSDFSIKENVEFLKNAYIKAGGYGESPQIVLAVKFDDESNVVYFQGVITSKDFKSFLENSFEDYFDLQVDINEFQGGIDRLINYVEILDNDSLPKGIPYRQFLESRSKSIENNRNKLNKKNQKKAGRVASDSIDYYLSSIRKVPLLTAYEELELLVHILNMKKIQQIPKSERSSKQRNAIKIGRRARDRIMASNLRLVVSIAKKYKNKGLELLDLVQEGVIGLERAVDKFDPAMGYKFSTYAYWWIRQGMIRALDSDDTREEDTSTLGELVPDPNFKEPMEGMDRTIQKEHLGTWLSQLNEREQKIMRLRFGLDGEEPLTLAEIGRQINVSRERVRQLEAKAILKLRVMTTNEEIISETELSKDSKNIKPKIKILGVGNGGINVLNDVMQFQNINEIVSYEKIDTDKKTLNLNKSSSTILIGEDSLKGLGTLGNPQYGLEAMEESKNLIDKKLENQNVIIILAGMGGGTGSGASPLIANIARKRNILTVAIVSMPASFEGKRRIRQAEAAVKNLNVDLLINNPYLDKNQVISQSDQYLTCMNKLMVEATNEIVEIINSNGLNDVNFEDIRSVLKNSGTSLIANGFGKEKGGIVEAMKQVLDSLRLKDQNIDRARGCLLIVRSGRLINKDTLEIASSIISHFIDENALLINGSVIDESFKDEIKVTVLLTKFSQRPRRGKNSSNQNNLKNRTVASEEYFNDLAV